MSRIYNFSAGPATLPEDVLAQVRDEMLDWHGAGMSVMEMSHRGAEFVSIAETATQDLRDLMAIPDNYKVLFLQGGATGQFAAIPLNIASADARADYVVTGSWGKKAHKEAQKYVGNSVVSAKPEGSFTGIPEVSSWDLGSDSAYVHITPNETIEGVEFHDIPDTGDIPLVGDMSSTFMSRPIDVSKYGVIYAGAQKNVGPAGLTIVIVREDLVGNAQANCPMVFDWEKQADADSMLNTPACFSWYVSGLVFKWAKQRGGLKAIGETNARKAAKLYEAIDTSSFYSNPVDKNARSRMNVPFLLADDALNADFLKQAEAVGLSTLKGHRSVGGMRASIYNAMPEAGVDALIDFMHEFEKGST